jgi:predicted extracellular nuclease
VLNYPDVIGVAEVENLATLQAIATKVNADAVAAAQPDPMYLAYLTEGNDVGGIDVGFLVKSSRINTTSVTQFGKTETYINPNTGLPETLFDRPPLVLMASITKAGCSTPISFTVVINHLRSLNGIADATEGPRARAKRKAQAEYLANFLQGRQTADATEKIICLGDFNAYQVNDGYVDVMGTIKGTPAPASQVVAASADLVNPNLINLTDSIPANERYSYQFSGSAQVLDHVLVTQSVAAQVSGYAVARLGADFPQTYYGDNSRPERLTDHDAPVAFFNFICPRLSVATDYFRTRASGNWNSTATWESSADGTNWQAATLTPDFNANTISILTGHAVTVTANVTVDQVIIKPSSSVTVSAGVKFTVL